MSNSLDILKLALEQSDEDVLNNYLQVCLDSKDVYKLSSNASLISLINSFFNKVMEHEKGLLILKTFLPHCKSDLVGQNLLKWLQICLRLLQTSNYSILLYDVLKDLIEYSKHFPDVRKESSLNIIPKMVDYFLKILKSDEKEMIPVLLCVEEVLIHYGKACNIWKNKLEGFLISQLENTPGNVQACARCYLQLAAISPSGQSTEEYEEQWYCKQQFLIGALHKVLNELFDQINEVQGSYCESLSETDLKHLPHIKENCQLKKVQRLTNQFINLGEFLRVLLIGNFPVFKQVDPDAVISIICRCLAVNCTTLQANITSDTLILSAHIPALHRACINILEGLILCCGKDLMSQANIICKLIMQTLKWTTITDWNYGQNKPFSKLRVDAYNCFNLWLTETTTASTIEQYIDDILPSILIDIHSKKPTVKLQVSTKRLQGKVGKKERKKLEKLSELENKLPLVLINSEANKDVCEAALRFISILLEVASFLISPNIHQKLQEYVVSELTMVQTLHKYSLDIPVPYANENCRQALYAALLSLCINHHPKFPAPCNYAVKLFNSGLSDNSLMVSQFCGQAVTSIEKMIHPVGPSFNFPLTLLHETSHKRIQNLKKNSKKVINNLNNNPNKNWESTNNLEENPELLKNKENCDNPELNIENKQFSNINDETTVIVEEDENETNQTFELTNDTDDIVILENDNQIDKGEISSKKVSEPIAEPLIVTDSSCGGVIDVDDDDNISDETTENNLAKKRTCQFNDNLQEEKRFKKSEERLVNINNDNKENDEAVNELENEMLSTFVDLVN